MKTQSSVWTWTWTLDFDLGFVNRLPTSCGTGLSRTKRKFEQHDDGEADQSPPTISSVITPFSTFQNYNYFKGDQLHGLTLMLS